MSFFVLRREGNISCLGALYTQETQASLSLPTWSRAGDRENGIPLGLCFGPGKNGVGRTRKSMLFSPFSHFCISLRPASRWGLTSYGLDETTKRGVTEVIFFPFFRFVRCGLIVFSCYFARWGYGITGQMGLYATRAYGNNNTTSLISHEGMGDVGIGRDDGDAFGFLR